MSHSDKPKIIILISGRGSNMRAIIEACEEGVINAEVALVISNRADAAGLVYANSVGIKTEVISHKDYAGRAAFDEALTKVISPCCPDLICLAGFMRILGASFVEAFPQKILNIHPSLLPKYKGLDTHSRAIEAGDEHAGCSVHIVTPDLDAGPVLVQTPVPILAGDTPDALGQRVLAVEHDSYIRGIKVFFE